MATERGGLIVCKMGPWSRTAGRDGMARRVSSDAMEEPPSNHGRESCVYVYRMCRYLLGPYFPWPSSIISLV